MAKSIQTTYVDAKQGQRKFLLMKLPASVITSISYAATRGQSEEEGAVQRVLNTGRINSVKAFALQGGDFPNAVVLNWVSKTNPITRKAGNLSFRPEPNSAQIIDGQHRIAGIKAAIEERPSLGKLEIPVVIYRDLTTTECADIFLSINTEQKPVARSLVFDLYGVASDHLVDQASDRARDIAMYLNTDPASPYYGEIKLPGAPTRRGGIPLSSAVTGIKPLVEEKGAFEQIQLVELEVQKQVVLNLFVALQRIYDHEWDNKNNAFLYAAGFLGAMDFLKLQLIPYCNIQESFEVETIANSISLEENALIYQVEVKGQSGGGAQKRVHERLVEAFIPAKKATKVKFKI